MLDKCSVFKNTFFCAGVAELVDAPDLGSGAERRGGSSPFTRTTYQIVFLYTILKIFFSDKPMTNVKGLFFPLAKIVGVIDVIHN